jgi:hypothetical protein
MSKIEEVMKEAMASYHSRIPVVMYSVEGVALHGREWLDQKEWLDRLPGNTSLVKLMLKVDRAAFEDCLGCKEALETERQKLLRSLAGE